MLFRGLKWITFQNIITSQIFWNEATNIISFFTTTVKRSTQPFPSHHTFVDFVPIPIQPINKSEDWLFFILSHTEVVWQEYDPEKYVFAINAKQPIKSLIHV